MQTRANAFKFRLPGSIRIMTAKSYVKNRFLLLLKMINFPILVTASCALLRNLWEQSLWSDIYEGRDWNKSFVTDTTQNLMLDRLKWYLKWWQICRLSRPTISCCSLSEDFSLHFTEILIYRNDTFPGQAEFQVEPAAIEWINLSRLKCHWQAFEEKIASWEIHGWRIIIPNIVATLGACSVVSCAS